MNQVLKVIKIKEPKKVLFSGCGGCNGGISHVQNRFTMDNYSVRSVRLYPYLQHHYSESFIDNICMIKIDTEGHDVVILSDLDEKLRPPVIWVEWFRRYKFLIYDDENQKFELEVHYNQKGVLFQLP